MKPGFRQPRTRLLDVREFAPSVHYAEYQRIPPASGYVRRLYDSELMYVYSGGILVHFEDEASPLALFAGDLLVLPPAVAHRIELTGTPDTRLLGLHFDLYDEVEIEFEHQLAIQDGDGGEDRIGYWPVTGAGSLVFARSYRSAPMELASWLEQAAEAYHASRPAASLACRGYMQLVLAALVGLSLEPQSPTVTAYQKRLLELRADLQQSLQLPHTNKSLARRLNVSEDYFIRLFKQLFGESPQKYVQRLRHQAAKRYLLETDEKIERIGALVGYDDLHNFSHAFKKWQGVSPQQYRKRFRGGVY
ncbi:AraC family transcriptional regulator [Cohnella sp. GbtcB17]|uniref:helix-turn-helix domain-containing protein n=1 Tax=Cohnella sp. GbtcB17 TaxID=2824762 RepID=UPI001C2FA197|nr:AraC family transcriptional regulator [Cohnella sp. GbtcB17]